MNDLPRQILREFIARYGPGLVDDPRRCEALWRDLAGGYRREVSALVGAVKEGVPADLQRTPAGVPLETRLAALATRLRDNTGLDADLASWAVDSWAIALGHAPNAMRDPEATVPQPPGPDSAQ